MSKHIYDRKRTYTRGVIAAVLLVVVIVTIGLYMITRSLPGSALYSVKVDRLERAETFLHFTSAAKTEYRLKLLSRRLEEMKRLQAEGALAGEALSTLSGEIEKDVNAFTDRLGTESATEGSVRLSSRAVGIIRAIERIVEALPTPLPEAQKMEDLRREVAGVHTKEVARFVKTEGEEVLQAFIARHLAIVASSVADGDFSSRTIAAVEDKIAEVSRALARNNVVGAVEAVFEAEQRIETDEYVAGTSAATKDT